MNVDYIYSIICPLTKRVMYIGLSVNPELRFKQRIRGHDYSEIGKWVYDMAKLGFVPILSIIDNAGEKTGFSLEQFYIEKFKSLGMASLNIFTANHKNMTVRNKGNRMSKYPFGRTEIAGTFEIDKSDVPSMKTALKAFNTRHGENMAIDYYESQPGRVLVTRLA